MYRYKAKPPKPVPEIKMNTVSSTVEVSIGKTAFLLGVMLIISAF
jgi:hypothetical protein